MATRHFLTLMDLEKAELHAIIQRAIALKNSPALHEDTLKHKTLAIEGVQFHPESILTEHGHAMLKNFLEQTA